MLAKAKSWAAVAAFAIALSCAARAEEPEKLNVLGTEMVLKIDGRKTGGAMAVAESVVKAGEGPPMHVHTKEDELFYVLDGRFRFWRGDEVLEAGPGTVAFLPRGVRHTYKNVGPGAGRLLLTITPAGFEGFFREVSKRGLTLPKDIQELTVLGNEYGLQFLGPPPQN